MLISKCTCSTSWSPGARLLESGPVVRGRPWLRFLASSRSAEPVERVINLQVERAKTRDRITVCLGRGGAVESWLSSWVLLNPPPSSSQCPNDAIWSYGFFPLVSCKLFLQSSKTACIYYLKMRLSTDQDRVKFSPFTSGWKNDFGSNWPLSGCTKTRVVNRFTNL